MSEVTNGRLGLYGADHLKCNSVMTLGFKGLAILISLTARQQSTEVFITEHKFYLILFVQHVDILAT